MKSWSPKHVRALFPLLWNVQHCWSPGSWPNPTFLPILWLHSWLMTPSFFQAWGHRHFRALPATGSPFLAGVSPCPCWELAVSAWGAWPAKPGRCYLPEGRGNPIQQLSVSFLIIDLSSCLHNQGIIYVLKLIRRPQCPGLQNSTIFSHLYLFWTFWALKLQTHTQLCRILV